MNAIKFEEALSELKQQVEEDQPNGGSSVFTSWITDALLDNTHRVSVVLYPDATYEQTLLEEEVLRLQAYKDNLSSTELTEARAKSAELKRIQSTPDSPESIATIPTLTLEDLNPLIQTYPIEVIPNARDSGVTLVTHELGLTSDIVYVNLGVDVGGVGFDKLPVLVLMSRMLLQNGIAGEYTDVELSHLIGTYTGGISVDLMIEDVHEDGLLNDDTDTNTQNKGGMVSSGTKLVTKLFLRGKAFTHYAEKLTTLIRKILMSADLSHRDKAIETLKELVSDAETSLAQRGHSYANKRIKARYSVFEYIHEHVGGVVGYGLMSKLLAVVETEEGWKDVQEQLEDVRRSILDPDTVRRGMILDVTGDVNVLEKVDPIISSFLTELPGTVKDTLDSDPTLSAHLVDHPWTESAHTHMAQYTPVLNEAILVPSRVQYVGLGGPIYNTSERYSGAVQVLSHYLQTGYFWDTVRVLNGAYGAYCVYNPFEGTMVFLSYRDPNLGLTLETFEGAPKELREAADQLANKEDNGMSQKLTNAIIGTIGDVDGGGLTASEKGWISLLRWIKRINPELRQQYRDDILNTKAADFLDLAERLEQRLVVVEGDTIKNAEDAFSIAVVGPEEKCQEAIDDGVNLELIRLGEGS